MSSKPGVSNLCFGAKPSFGKLAIFHLFWLWRLLCPGALTAAQLLHHGLGLLFLCLPLLGGLRQSLTEVFSMAHSRHALLHGKAAFLPRIFLPKLQLIVALDNALLCMSGINTAPSLEFPPYDWLGVMHWYCIPKHHNLEWG